MDAVRYLLTVADPSEEGRYSSGLIRYSAEPSETLMIVRENAYAALMNFEDPVVPVVPDDDLFVEVESKIQQFAHDRLSSELTSYHRWAAGSAVLVGIMVGAIFNAAVLPIALALGGLTLLTSLAMAVVAGRKLRGADQVLQRIHQARRLLHRP